MPNGSCISKQMRLRRRDELLAVQSGGTKLSRDGDRMHSREPDSWTADGSCEPIAIDVIGR
jgi:hypothetical protein